jgi:ribosomal protein S18 acetylase RimI-like enzyme
MTPQQNLRIEPYNAAYHDAFRDLNLYWLEKYNLTEAPDLQVLDNPDDIILAHGGFIWLALVGDSVVGSAALVKEHNDVFELAKMAVASEWQGKGIARRLIETCISKAAECRAKKIVLYSNHQLIAALRLYEQYGFTYVPITDSPFKTADIMMQRSI